MTLERKIFLGYILLFALFSGLVFHFYTPSTQIVKITDTETKRVDAEGIISSKNPADGPTRDVYYISVDTKNDKSVMYRNEDTAWGFPWYFKFNSADIQARASSIKESGRYGILTSYGWRLNIPMMFKNIVSLRPTADADASTFTMYTFVAIGSWLVWIGLIAVQVYGYIRFSRWREKRELYGSYK